MSTDLDEIVARIATGIYGDDRLSKEERDDAFSALAEVIAEVERLRAEVDGSRAHTLAVEQQNIALLRWQSVASDAHVDHLCDIIRSLAVADETPRTLRDLSAMGIEEEVRRAVVAERINRQKSETAAREWRKKAEDAEADLLTAQQAERAAVVAYLAARGGICLDLAHDIERGEHRKEEGR